MPTLEEFYKTYDSKPGTVVVRAGSTVLQQVVSVDITYAINRVPTATVRIRGTPPGAVAFFEDLIIDSGFSIASQRRFTGKIFHINPSEEETTIEAMGTSWALDVPFRDIIKTFDHITAQNAILEFLANAGITNRSVNVPAWTIGTVNLSSDPARSKVTLSFETWAEAINKVGDPDGSRWFESPTGAIIVRPLDPIPGNVAWREYFSMVLSGIQETYPASVAQAFNGRPTRPRLYSFRAEQQVREVKNRCIVRGATYEQVNGDGSVSGIDVTESAQASSPWIRNADGTQAYNTELFSNELIDTVAKAAQVAGRRVGVTNRLNYRATATIDDDPEMALGQTIYIGDDAYSRVKAKFFVEGYTVSIQPGSGGASGTWLMNLNLYGGENAGGQVNIAPFALFTWTVEREVINDRLYAVVTFDGRGSSDSDGTVVSWSWSDNLAIVSGTGPVKFVRVDTALSGWQVTLTVTDNLGLTDTITLPVDITAGAAGVHVPAMFVAFGNFYSASPDGGITWNDQGTGGKVCVATCARPPDGGIFGIGLFGNTDGTVYRTTDYCRTAPTLVLTIPGGSPIAHIWFNVLVADEVYVVTQSGLLYRSLDSGVTWFLYDDMRVVLGLPNLRINRIACPRPDGIWLFGGEGNGLPLIVRDPVKTHQWAKALLGGDMTTDFGLGGTPGSLIATTRSASPRTATVLTGSTWGALVAMAGVTDNDPRPFAFPGLILVTNGGGTPAQSTDGGVTFTALPALAKLIWAARDAGGRIWALCEGSVSNVSDIYYSDAPYTSWTGGTGVLHATTRTPGMIACHPSNSNIIFVVGQATVGNPGWIYYSIDRGVSWTDYIGSTRPRAGLGTGSGSERYGAGILGNGTLVVSGKGIADGVGTHHQIMTSVDGGATWATPYSDATAGNQITGLGMQSSGKIVTTLHNTPPAPDEDKPVVSTDSGVSFATVTPANGSLQSFTGNNAIVVTAMTYDSANDAMYVATDDVNFPVVKLSPVSATGSWVNMKDAIPSTSFGGGNLAVLTGAGGGGAPSDLYIVEAAADATGHLAILLNSSTHLPALYYNDDINGDGSHWRRALNAPAKTHGRWMAPDMQDGRFCFGYDDNLNYTADALGLSPDVLTVTQAAGALTAGDTPNHGIWIGFFIGNGGSNYIVAAEGAADGTLYKTWDRFATNPVQKLRPATSFPAAPAGSDAKMISVSEGSLASPLSDRLVSIDRAPNPDQFKTLYGPTTAWSAATNITGLNNNGAHIVPLTDQIWWAGTGRDGPFFHSARGAGFISVNAGATWAACGTPPGGGANYGIWDVCRIPSTGRIYAIGQLDTGGFNRTAIWYTDDVCATWKIATIVGSGSSQVFSPFAIHAHPNNENIVAGLVVAAYNGSTAPSVIATSINAAATLPTFTQRTCIFFEGQAGAQSMYGSAFLPSGRIIINGFISGNGTQRIQAAYTDDYGATALHYSWTAPSDSVSGHIGPMVVANGLRILYLWRSGGAATWQQFLSTDGGTSFAEIILSQSLNAFWAAEGLAANPSFDCKTADPALDRAYLGSSDKHVAALTPMSAAGVWTRLSRSGMNYFSGGGPVIPPNSLAFIPRP